LRFTRPFTTKTEKTNGRESIGFVWELNIPLLRWSVPQLETLPERVHLQITL